MTLFSHRGCFIWKTHIHPFLAMNYLHTVVESFWIMNTLTFRELRDERRDFMQQSHTIAVSFEKHRSIPSPAMLFSHHSCTTWKILWNKHGYAHLPSALRWRAWFQAAPSHSSRIIWMTNIHPILFHELFSYHSCIIWNELRNKSWAH